MIETLEEQLQPAEAEWMRRKGKQDALEIEKLEIERKWDRLRDELDCLDQVHILLQKSAEHARRQAKEQIQTLVTNSLQYIFGNMFRFEIELTEMGKTPSAEFYVVSEWEGEPIKNKPQDSRGGGVIDIISLALRIAIMETLQPRLVGPLLFDEPGKHVSEDFIVPMVELLQSICQSFDRQIIMVTHNTHLSESADQAFQVRLSKGRSELTTSHRLDNAIL